MISPSPGVKPMVVSTERPWSTAQSEAPLPRWQLTISSSFTPPLQVLRRAEADIVVRRSRESRSGARPSSRNTRKAGRRDMRRTAACGETPCRKRPRAARPGTPERLADAGDVHRIVQRRERVQSFNLAEHFVIDHQRLAEPFAAMHHAMANHADFRRLANDPRVLGRQLAQHRLEASPYPPRKFAFTSPAGPWMDVP